MALTKDFIINDNFGIDVTITSCYVVVNDVVGDKQAMNAYVHFYKDSNKSQLLTVKTYVFQPLLADINIFEQSYAHLKTLSEFSDASDC
jgi:hypothetical protein